MLRNCKFRLHPTNQQAAKLMSALDAYAGGSITVLSNLQATEFYHAMI
ncbi:helix-turn-helix domain-containing protein [Candidatus Nitrososphaera gargensis]|nr:helix-turn-helix domain-containing protein [Candidatus Nitrososphaera gargensis]